MQGDGDVQQQGNGRRQDLRPAPVQREQRARSDLQQLQPITLGARPRNTADTSRVDSAVKLPC